MFNVALRQATALHMAAQGGHLDIVDALIGAGAHVNTRMTLGVSALGVAAERGHTTVVQRLIRAGASVGFKNLHGVTAVAAAAAGQHIDTVRALAAAGAKMSTRDRNGTTALHVAARDGRSAVAAVLLELGADPTAVDDDGRTPADIARRRRDFDMVTLIGKHEAALAAAGRLDQDSDGKTKSDEDEEEPPQIVRVSRVRQGGEMYLVDKNTGIVYSNNLDDPTQIGTWSQSDGVVLNSDASHTPVDERSSNRDDL